MRRPTEKRDLLFGFVGPLADFLPPTGVKTPVYRVMANLARRQKPMLSETFAGHTEGNGSFPLSCPVRAFSAVFFPTKNL